jgi:hypothetical protein
MRYRGSYCVCTVFAIGLLLASSFVWSPSEVDATIVNIGDDRGIYIYTENLDGQTIYVGDRGVDFYLRIRNGDNDEFVDDDPIRHCNVTIDEVVRDTDGNVVTTPISNWIVRENLANATLYDGGSFHTFYGFEFDVKPDADTTTYNLTVKMRYRTSDDYSASFTGYIHFDISPRAALYDVTGLYPGDRKKAIDVHVDVYSTMTDTTLELTAPNGFSWYGSSTQTISAYRDGSWSYDWYVPFTISVHQGMEPEPEGHKGVYRLMYENPYGLHIIEMGEIAFHVGALPMLTASMEMDEFVQGTTTTTLTVEVENTGNVDIMEGKVWIDDVSTAFLYTAADHYEGSDTVSYSEVGFGDLRMNEQTTVEFPLVVNTFIPEGKHKLLFDFSCTFLDPLSKAYRDVYTWWYPDSDGAYPVVNIDGGNIYLQSETSELAGTFETIQVLDESVEVRVESVTTLDLGGQLVDNWVVLYVENYGNVDYDNVVVALETNSEESPFLNPVDRDSPVAEEIVMGSTLVAGRTYSAAAHLTIKRGTEPGVYLVPMDLSGINADTGTVFQTELEARITLRGIGPRLKITEVSPSEVSPGDDFTLELTVSNVGDDTAWNTVLSVPPSWTEKEGAPSGVENAVSTPEPESLPIHLGDLRPGDQMTIEVPMRCSDCVEGGSIFPFYFCINCTDSYGYHPQDDALNYEVAIKTKSSMTDSPWLTVIVVVVIGFIIVLAIVVTRRRGGGSVETPRMEPGPPAPVGGPAEAPEAGHPTVEQFGRARQTPPVVAEATAPDVPPPPAEVAKPPAERARPPAKPPAKSKPPASDLGKSSGIPLIAPGFLDGAFKDGAVHLNWKRPLGEERENIKGYRVLRWNEGSDLEQMGEVEGSLEYTDKKVQPGTTYNYAVQAFNDRGQSDASNWIAITTP